MTVLRIETLCHAGWNGRVEAGGEGNTIRGTGPDKIMLVFGLGRQAVFPSRASQDTEMLGASLGRQRCITRIRKQAAL